MTNPCEGTTMKVKPPGRQVPGGTRKGKIMANPQAPTTAVPTSPADSPTTAREHSEIAAEGSDGREMPELRMHSQEAAEGPDPA